MVNTLVDEELDLRILVDKINEKGSSVGDHVMAMVNRLLGASHHGSLSKQLLRQAWTAVFMESFQSFLGQAVKQTDQNLRQQVAAIKKFGKPITEIEAVVDEDVKQRISEKAGV